jgi:DNA ligase-1
MSEIYSIKAGKIEFGPLYNNLNNKIRIWELFIELYNENDELVKIKNINMKLQDEMYCTLYTNTGYQNMKITKSADTIISTGKNLGKKNKTTVITQAISDATSRYNLKVKGGYSLTIEEKKEDDILFPFPMAVNTYQNHSNKLKYPLYVQPKLDGLRMLAKLYNGKVILTSRRMHEIIGFEKLKQELQIILEQIDVDLILDGELYKHGMNLQTISGIVRNEDNLEEKDQLQFWLFDCFQVNDTSGFEDRINLLSTLLEDHEFNYIKLTETKKINSSEEADDYFNQVVEDGYEGIIYKSIDRHYEYSFDKEKRSMYYLKRKKQFDAEFEIIGYTSGVGKNKETVIFIYKTTEGFEFNSVPNGTYEYLKELYQDCLENFDSKYKGQFSKLAFDDLSKDNVPLRARVTQVIRDMSFD